MLRRTISLTLFLSLILLTISSTVLYILPEGRVAYWADWKFIFLSKGEWGDIHVTGGLLFIISSISHIIINIKPLCTYISKCRTDIMPIFISIIICIIVYIGTILNIIPFNYVSEFSHYIKAWQEQRLGTPPYGHAEASTLKQFCKLTGIRLEYVVGCLEKQHLKVPTGEDTTLLDIARANGISPANVFEKIRSSLPSGISIKKKAGRGGKAE